jgi:hypothetical protein
MPQAKAPIAWVLATPLLMIKITLRIIFSICTFKTLLVVILVI